MNEFKFFQKNKIYKPGDTVAVICERYDHYINWVNDRRRNCDKNTICRISNRNVKRFDTINGVRYVCVNRPEKVRGYLFNDVIVLENAHENPFFEEINYCIIPCLVNETV